MNAGRFPLRVQHQAVEARLLYNTPRAELTVDHVHFVSRDAEQGGGKKPTHSRNAFLAAAARSRLKRPSSCWALMMCLVRARYRGELDALSPLK